MAKYKLLQCIYHSTVLDSSNNRLIGIKISLLYMYNLTVPLGDLPIDRHKNLPVFRNSFLSFLLFEFNFEHLKCNLPRQSTTTRSYSTRQTTDHPISKPLLFFEHAAASVRHPDTWQLKFLNSHLSNRVPCLVERQQSRRFLACLCRQFSSNWQYGNCD